MRALVVLVMTVTALAGCVSDGGEQQMEGPGYVVASEDPFFNNTLYEATFDIGRLSQPVHDILPVEEVWVTTSDGLGTRIHNAVFRPDTDEPTPVFINFSPYHGDSAETGGDGFGQYMINNFVPRGYTVILSSLRGTGHSEGCFEVGSDREAKDLQEVVDFFAQQPWSNGAVAAGGKSYDSTPQNAMIAKYPTPNLKGLFHVSGITDFYDYTFHNGLTTRGAVGSTIFTPVYSVGQGTHEYGIIGAGESADRDNDDVTTYSRLGGDIACAENAETGTMSGASTASGAKTPYWVERDWTRTIGDSEWEGSIFFYHGFHDWNVQPEHILPWLDNLPDTIQTKVWLHQDRENGGHLYPMRDDWNLTMLRWMDEELKGIDTGFWAGPTNELQGSDLLWREQAAWPDRSNVTTLSIGADGLVAEATDHALRYSGNPVIRATVTPLTSDPVFSAILYEVDTNGTQIHRNEATLRVIYHEGLEEPVALTPMQPIEIAVEFYPSDDVLPVGHKWIVALQEEPRHVSWETPGRLEGLTVAQEGLSVDIAIVPADDGVLEHQPAPTPCHAC